LFQKNHKTTAALVDRTAELNIHLDCFHEAVQHELQKSDIHSRAAIAKPLITECNAQMCTGCCYDHKTWISENGNACIIWPDEFFFMLLHTPGRVYIRRTPKEAYNPECLVPTVKHWGGSIMVRVTLL
jgi:hypothetical protein